ncbi:hypothetical protein G9274_002524 [Stenotrophomonas rhizophila]|nr:hypothetical protein G9274_002524 [Stenotrophomonas rhizophila]
MDVKTVLSECGLDDRHFQVLGIAVPEAYAALNQLSLSTPMLGAFPQGVRGLSYLRDIAVQHALEARAADSKLFFTSTARNPSGNHMFLKLQVGQVVITTHYSGARGARSVRKAVSRGELATRTPDLFLAQGTMPDHCPIIRSAYAQLVHAGLDQPKFAMLQIPDRDQKAAKLTPHVLELQVPSKGAVEEVQDRLNEAFKVKVPNSGARQDRDVG